MNGRPILSRGLLALVLAVVWAPLAQAAIPAPAPGASALGLPAVRAVTGAALATQPCFGAASRDPEADCENPALRLAVQPSPFDAVLEPSEPCQPITGAGVEACTFGVSKASAAATVALIGDSHAIHWRAALAEVAGARGWHGISLTRSGCPYTLSTSRGGADCRGWARKVLAWLGRHPEVEAVVTSASTGARVKPAKGHTEVETRIGGYRRALTTIPGSVKDVYVIRDVPHMTFRTLGCVNDAIEQGEEAGLVCSRPRTDALRRDLVVEAARRAGAARLHAIDLTDFMCDASSCFPVIGGALVSKDAGHLTRTYSLTMGPYLGRAMSMAALPVPGPLPAPAVPAAPPAPAQP